MAVCRECQEGDMTRDLEKNTCLKVGMAGLSILMPLILLLSLAIAIWAHG